MNRIREVANAGHDTGNRSWTFSRLDNRPTTEFARRPVPANADRLSSGASRDRSTSREVVTALMTGGQGVDVGAAAVAGLDPLSELLVPCLARHGQWNPGRVGDQKAIDDDIIGAHLRLGFRSSTVLASGHRAQRVEQTKQVGRGDPDVQVY